MRCSRRHADMIGRLCTLALACLLLVGRCSSTGYICYQYTANDEANRLGCLRHKDFVFTGGENTGEYAGCGDCHCCQPADAPSAFENCLDYAHSTPFKDTILQPRSLPDPKVPLVAHKWSGRQPSKEFFDGGYKERIKNGFIRYKIVNRKAYVDGDAVDNVRHFENYRKVFDEMLVFAAWLYQLPDMDIMLNTLDRPWPVPEFPVISWAFEGTISDGYSIPHHVHWDRLGLSSGQLEHYMQCIDKKYPWHNKKPKVIWRGSPTGGVRGWDVPTWNPEWATEKDAWKALNYSQRMMHNKRAFVSLLSHKFPFMDVGLIPDSWPVYVEAFGSTLESLESQTFFKLLTRPRVSTEDWNKYAGQLSMDGHGFSDRVPFLLLSNTPALMLESPQKEWFMDSFQDGVHIRKFSSDASDVVLKGRELVDEFLSAQGQTQAMVQRMRQVALSRFSVLAVMDAFAWALVDASKWCKWKVELAPEFRPLNVSNTGIAKYPYFNRRIPEDIWAKIVADSQRVKPVDTMFGAVLNRLGS